MAGKIDVVTLEYLSYMHSNQLVPEIHFQIHKVSLTLSPNRENWKDVGQLNCNLLDANPLDRAGRIDGNPGSIRS